MNHGNAALTLETGIDEAKADMKKLTEIGIDINAVCAQLLADGLKSFNAAFESLMSAIERKAG